VPRREACLVCGGSGAKPGTQPRTCPKCNGAGQVQHTRQTGFARIMQIVTCDRCQGRKTIVDSPCLECRSTGAVERLRKISVKVPAGVETGMRLRLRGEGERGIRKGPPGDLYVVVHVKPHDLFEREGDDIIYEAQVGIAQVALGAEIEVPTVDSKARLRIPPGTQSGTLFRLKGKGVKHLNGWGRGDELVRVTVKTPTNLTKKQRALLAELAHEMGEDAMGA